MLLGRCLAPDKGWMSGRSDYAYTVSHPPIAPSADSDQPTAFGRFSTAIVNSRLMSLWTRRFILVIVVEVIVVIAMAIFSATFTP